MTILRSQTSLILACGLALIALPGAFAAEPSGKPTVDDMFKSADTNSDGKLSRAENAASSKKMFADMDTNHDGTVSVTEMTADQGRMKAGMSGQAGQPGKAAAVANGMFKTQDKNNDGKLTVAEHDAACEAMFAKMDKNNDGTLSPDECKDGEKSMGN